MRRLWLLLLLTIPMHAAVVIDRIAVVVGKHVVKLSDVERDVRVTEFLNRQPFTISAAEKRQAADRLVDQQIIREELATGGYARASDDDAKAMLDQLRKTVYAGSDTRLRQALSGYGLTEDQLQAQLLWQITVLRFIDQRFRAGVLVTDEEVQTYYDRHAELHKTAFAAAAPQIRTSLEGEQVNKQFEAWLDDTRKQQRVDYRAEALK